MAAESRNDTWDVLQLVWDSSTELQKELYETFLKIVRIIAMFLDDKHNNVVISSITLLISLCGMVGNGTVIWLLGFRVKRNPYSVYILNLAIADFLYLLSNALDFSTTFAQYYSAFSWFMFIVHLISYPVGLTLLMAISVERCVSVLWPLWYKCHRPAHLSTIVCALIWGLYVINFLVCILLIFIGVFYWIIPVLFCHTMSLLTLLVLFVSSLILGIWGRCFSQRKQPSKLYWTILLNVLAVLLLSVPRGIWVIISWLFVTKIPWSIIFLLSAVNSSVNPVIYFFVGRHRLQRGRKSLQEVLQSALTDGKTGTEQRRGIRDPRQSRMTPEHEGRGSPAESPGLTLPRAPPLGKSLTFPGTVQSIV